MRREKRLQILGAGLALLAMSLVALSFAGESPNYRSYLEVIDCGGGVSRSDSCLSQASIAQPAVGTTRSESYATDAGYMSTATAPPAPGTNKLMTIPPLEEIKEQAPPWAQVEIDEAIEFILKSLDSLLWVDEWHLNVDPIPGFDGGGGGNEGSGEESALTGKTLVQPGAFDRHWDYGRHGPASESSMDAAWPDRSSEPHSQFSPQAGVDNRSYWDTESGHGEEGPPDPRDPSGGEDPHRYGSLVFKWEEKAAKKIMNLALHLPGFAEKLGEVIEDLLAADSTLAEVAIVEAEAGGGDPRELKKAREQMERAERAKSRGDFDAAIACYGEAWGRAVDALWGSGSGGPHAAGVGDTTLRFALYQNHPNPFSRSTSIRYSVPGSTRAGEQGSHSSTYQRINLSVYDITGRLVRVLVDGKKKAGHHSIHWDARDDAGKRASAGIYFYRLRVRTSSSGGAGYLTSTKKMILLR